MKNVMVLGSNSFSGSHFCNRLLQSGYRVIGVSRSLEPNAVFLPYKWSISRGFTFHRLDINRNLNAIVALAEREKPAYVVNFAALGMVAESWKNPGDWLSTNTTSQVLLHDRLRHFDFLEKYVHISTPEVYGPCSEKMPETDIYHPSTPYAVSRAATDMSLMTFFKAYKFPVVFTRAANVYGPGQQLYRLFPRTAMAAIGNIQMRLNNGGASKRSFIHIHDVVEGTMTIMERGIPGEIYHMATNRLSTVREAAEAIAVAAGVKLNDIAEIGAKRLGRDAIYNLDSSKMRTDFGWSDTVRLEDGASEMVAWVRDNLSVLCGESLEYVHKA